MKLWLYLLEKIFSWKYQYNWQIWPIVCVLIDTKLEYLQTQFLGMKLFHQEYENM